MTIDAVSHRIEVYRYPIFTSLSFLEGPIISFVAGALAALGYLNPVIALSIFIAKDIILDGAYCLLGRASGKAVFTKRIFARLRITIERILEIKETWDKNAVVRCSPVNSLGAFADLPHCLRDH